MANKKIKRPAPLKPHLKGGIVIIRIPAGTPDKEYREARTWARNVAKKINLRHERDHYNERGW